MFALFIILVSWHWLERGKSGLFIQLKFISCAFFRDYVFIMYIDDLFDVYPAAITYV